MSCSLSSIKANLNSRGWTIQTENRSRSHCEAVACLCLQCRHNSVPAFPFTLTPGSGSSSGSGNGNDRWWRKLSNACSHDWVYWGELTVGKTAMSVDCGVWVVTRIWEDLITWHRSTSRHSWSHRLGASWPHQCPDCCTKGTLTNYVLCFIFLFITI